MRGSTLILAYHNIVPHGQNPVGDRSLHLAQRDCAAHLNTLGETHDVVPLEEALEDALEDRHGARAGRGERPRAAITFDDAYRGAVTAGIGELARRRLPATLFVAPAFVGGGSFWWDALADSAMGAPAPAMRARALAALHGRDEEIRSWASREGMVMNDLPHHARCATEDELAAACDHSGITIASHSWSHANLATLGDTELAAELSRPVTWLRSRFPRVLPFVSYPYGASSEAVERAAAAAGYRAALRIEGGWVRGGIDNAFAVPRLNIPAGLSARGFALRAAGLFRA